MISASKLREMSMRKLIRFGESLGLSMDGVDSKGGAISRLVRSAVEFRNIA